MTFFRSFRFRIASLAVLLSSAVLLLFGFAAWSLTYRMAVDRIDHQLREEGRRHSNESRRPEHWERFERQMRGGEDGPQQIAAMAVIARDRDTGHVNFQSSNWPRGVKDDQFADPPQPRPAAPEVRLPPGGFTRPEGLGPPGNPFRAPMQVQPQGPPPPVSFGTIRTVHASDGNWRVGVVGTDRATFIVAASLAPLEKNMAQLSHAMLAAAIPGLLLIAAAGGFLAARALRPISVLTRTAEQITARGLSQRMPATREAEEFQRLTDVFNDMLDRLEKSFQQATRFSADAAHELKTPLTILQGQLEESLREAADGSAQQVLCADLLEEVQRLKNITRKLLLLSMADAGGLRLNSEPVDLSALVENAAEDARILAPNLKIKTNISSSVTHSADPDLIGQVVQNLVSNAIKYNRDDGFILLELERSKRGIRLAVTNSGDPIPAAAQNKLFERFFRADPSRTKSVDGVGLGLSLAREIARSHGGDLVLEKSDDSGTTFALLLVTGSAAS